MFCQDVFMTFWRRLQDSLPEDLEDIFKTSSRHFEDFLKTCSRHLQNVLQRCLQDVFKTYHQLKLFLITRFREVFNTFLRCTDTAIIYRRICLGHTLLHLLAAYRCVLRASSNIYNGAFLLKYVADNYFRKRAPSQVFDCVENKLLAKGLKYRVHSCSQSTNEAKEILSQKICVISFFKRWKVESKQNKSLCRSSRPISSLK